MVMDIMLRKR